MGLKKGKLLCLKCVQRLGGKEWREAFSHTNRVLQVSGTKFQSGFRLQQFPLSKPQHPFIFPHICQPRLFSPVVEYNQVHLSTDLMCKFKVLVFYFKFFHFMQLYTSTPLHQRQKTLQFLLHCICLAALVTSFFSEYYFLNSSCPVKTTHLQII